MIDITQFLLCPSCETGELAVTEEQIVCTLCNNSLSWVDNVLVADGDNQRYWCEISRDTMHAFLDEARQNDWQSAIANALNSTMRGESHLLRGRNRADWFEYIGEGPKKILDVGSGFGQTTYLLAANRKNCVVSLEMTLERAQFQGIRKQQEGLTNLSVINGDIMTTPFTPDTFDVISYIGVLEWLGTGDTTRSPREVQLAALKKNHAMLRSGGCVCIGIENRISFKYLLGSRDHTGLRFTSLMPRKIADAYVKLRNPEFNFNRHAGYRTYTYSIPGYKKLLRDAGFSKHQVRIAFPNYTNPSCIMEPENAIVGEFMSNIYQPTSVRHGVFATILGWLCKFRLGVMLAPYVYIYGYK